MVSSKLLGLSAVALLPLALAAPAPASESAKIQWIPVVRDGKTLYVNSDAVVTPNPDEKARRTLLSREADYCNGATVDSHPPPFANTADCIYIRDWNAARDIRYSIWTNTPDTHVVQRWGTCVFEAGTSNFIDVAYMGSSNIRDIMTLAINKWQSGGVIASQGSTVCSFGGRESSVRWTIKHS